MTSNDHLQQLVELRDALLREIARLDAVIANEKAQRRDAHEPGRIWAHDSLSWEDALHRAKIPQSHEAHAWHA